MKPFSVSNRKEEVRGRDDETTSKILDTTPWAAPYSLVSASRDQFCDPNGPYHINKQIEGAIKQWDQLQHQLEPTNPNAFLSKILLSRGYDAAPIDAMHSELRR
jgi:hypothetical protein